jgi:hypothetical protein
MECCGFSPTLAAKIRRGGRRGWGTRTIFVIAKSTGERVIFFSMRIKGQFSAFLLGAVLVIAPASGWSQQSAPNQDGGVKHDAKVTGHDTKVVGKDTGHDTKVVAKDTGHGVKKGTTTAYDKTKHGTTKAWHKTKDTTTGAAHGAKEGAKQPDK